MKGISSAEQEKQFKKMCNDAHSDELDVFEATVYFSGYNEFSSGGHRHIQKYGYNAVKEESRKRLGIFGGERRISLDLPIRCSEQVTTTKERIGNVRYKQPSSPSGKFVSFLNSLFHQAGSKKNKTKTKSAEQELEEEIQGGGGWMRRRRRSSISHFLSSSRSNSTTTRTSKPLFCSSSSGFRTPPPCLNTRDETLKVIESLSEKKVWGEHDDDDDDLRVKKEGDDNDDAMESDSSSDLFELQNYKT